MKLYVEAYDENNRQILGNTEGQTVLRARNYRRTKYYKGIVRGEYPDGMKRLSPRVKEWRIVTEKGQLIEIIPNLNWIRPL